MQDSRSQVTAFGPFAETVTVDFDELGADGLFLLPGRPARARRDPGRGCLRALRNGPRCPQGGSSVCCRKRACGIGAGGDAGGDDRLAGGQDHAQPRIQRAKKRRHRHDHRERQGDLWRGSTATARTCPGSRTSPREVERLLGMTADQFFQVVLLPQGEFAKFLRADTRGTRQAAREAFRHQAFSRAVEEWFVDRKRASGRARRGERKQSSWRWRRCRAAEGIEAGSDGEPLVWRGACSTRRSRTAS